ncbi:hypothetical protein GCM10010967_34970 [Dyadobacter beijingensis]|uniref:Secretion system C-terminal sorting domain-containing protein n=1 Tax=Dyadobacter beijingensis TaxID=365489 RepID=A0ABQ2I4L8_9BACT|nr:FG-GAP-like repeat-containing protein [Dyadobacter beijingensis]GGM98161.1 hypothetical protein GCM10010967_34970 [Dyadobacter beijingensis]
MKKIYQQAMAVALASTTLLGIGVWQKSRLAHPLPEKTIAQNTEALPSGVTEATMADIRSALEKQEYHISYDDKVQSLQSPNRAQNLRAYYRPGQLTVQTRVDTTGHRFKLDLINEGIYADGKPLYTPQANAKADHKDNKVQISHTAFTEEFVNNEDGVRQNFIIGEAPAGTRALQVRMTARGLKVQQGNGNELRFYTESNGETRNELVYNSLQCWDANKKPLDATLAYVNKRIEINVDVAGAAYPVTIDPIITNGTPQNSNKVIEMNQSSMWLGYSVSSAGDVNGDGYSDVIIGAPRYDLGQTDEGAAIWYPGTANGLSANGTILQCNQDSAQMGYSVATAGDFNGDGYSDILVGAPLFNINGKDDGIVKMYFGSAQGIAANATPKDFFTGNPGDNYGISVAPAGDIDADGFSDVILGAAKFDFGINNQGAAMVIYGAQNNYKKVEQLTASQANAQFGFSVSSAGDINGDGYSDVLVGARFYTNVENQEGAVFVYKGGANGLDINNPSIIEGNQPGATMGYRVSTAGDVNGDGYSDFLVSAIQYDNGESNEGKVSLYMGMSSGFDPFPKKTFEANSVDAAMGTSLASAGDVNGDGYADILIGCQRCDFGQNNEGGVFIYHGSKDGIGNSYASLLESNQVEGWFGTAVASAGDVNGDGYSDIVIGCYTFDNGQVDEGHAFIYQGGAEGVGTNESVFVTNNKASAQMGLSVASAGDVNGDGYSDVIVGAPTYDNGEASEGVAFVYKGSATGLNTANYNILQKNQANSYFGGSVASAGDINGDGYDEVIVGAKEYTDGHTNEGAAFIYYGSNTGIDQAANPLSIQANKNDTDFGYIVAGLGDINRDGYADFAIGAPAFANTGNIFVYYGTQNGISAPVTLAGQINSHFGESVSAAGDVNGDGYADVVAGAWGASYGEQSEGAIYIYHGSAGLMNTNYVKSIESNQVDARFGISIASAGDVNGDGYGDIIAGASRHDHPEVDEGIAVVYYGTNIGIGNGPAPTVLEGNVAGAYFGAAVGGAGDVNGDGYSDVIVGSYNLSNGLNQEGKVYVFHGSPDGTKTAASFSIEGEQLQARLGWSVAGAGDVNGDGYSDVLVGEPAFNNGAVADAGATTVFYGNNGKSLRNNVRLYNTSDMTTPINHAQFNAGNFGTGLFAKSFLGVNKGKLAIEYKGQGVPFSKISIYPITTSNLYSFLAPNFSNLAGTGTELKITGVKQGVSTKVRVRVRYSPVLAITGQMYGPWRYIQPQLSGINNAPVPEEAMAETIKRKAEPSEELEDVVTLFPNPATDRLSVQVANPNDVRSVRLFNTAGKLVHQLPRYEKDIDVSNLPGGVHILILDRANGKSSSHKILIRR